MATISLFECSLNQKAIPSEGQQWLKQLERYAKRHRPNDTPGSTGNQGPLVVREERHPRDVMWRGRPFVLIGSKADVTRFLSHLDQSTETLLRDCAYYWIVTDDADAVYDDRPSLFNAGARAVVLSWFEMNYAEVWRALRELHEFPGLTGLSVGLSRIRSEIRRIASQDLGPWAPVLILGESGTGKEEVARALHDARPRVIDGNKPTIRFAPVACGSLSEELLLDKLFGHLKGSFTGATKDTWGLLHRQFDTLFVDDFDAAPPSVQGAMLRVLSTKREERAAVIPRQGEEQVDSSKLTKKEHRSSIWPLFATNADIRSLVSGGKLREDFLFRFEDRVIAIPRLKDRPADVPAIARRFWEVLWEKDDDDVPRPIADVFPWLLERGLRWNGNLRSLRTLLTLAFSMGRLPTHNKDATCAIFEEILARGPEHLDWVGILAHPTFTGALGSTDALVEEIRRVDADRSDLGPATIKPLKPDWPGTRSEACASMMLSDDGRKRMNDLLSSYGATRSGKVVRTSVRLSRIVCYAGSTNTVHWRTCEELNSVGEATSRKDLEQLAQAGLLAAKRHQAPETRGPVEFEPVKGMFSGKHFAEAMNAL